MKAVSWVNLVLGIWLLVAPWALHEAGIAETNSIVMGIVVAGIAALSLVAPPRRHLPAWINVAAGLWVLFSPWALHINRQTPVVVTSALAGALVIIFALARSSAGREVVGA